MRPNVNCGLHRVNTPTMLDLLMHLFLRCAFLLIPQLVEGQTNNPNRKAFGPLDLLTGEVSGWVGGWESEWVG